MNFVAWRNQVQTSSGIPSTLQVTFHGSVDGTTTCWGRVGSSEFMALQKSKPKPGLVASSNPRVFRIAPIAPCDAHHAQLHAHVFWIYTHVYPLE